MHKVEKKIVSRIIRSVKTNGLIGFFRIIRLRIKTGFQVMIGRSPAFANELLLPSSEKIISEREHALYSGETNKYNSTISIQESETMFWQIWHKLKDEKFTSLSVINSAVPFNATYNQRPMNLAKHLAKNNYLVIFVCWQWSPEEKLDNGYKEVYPNLYEIPMYQFLACQAQFTDIINNSYNWRAKKLFITLPSRHFIPLLYELRKLEFQIIYDILDEWEEFHKYGQAPWFQEETEEEYILNADKIFVVSPSLKDKFSPLRVDIEVNGNGYSPEMLQSTSKFIACNNSSSEIQQNPKVGYFGHLTEAWFDWDFVFQLAQKSPEITFEIIGYGCSDETLRQLDFQKNIKYLGKKSHEDLKYYAATWKAGMIPFKRTVLSEAVDPIKIYEYLYFGLPTLVTGISHLHKYPFTKVIDSVDDACKQLPELILDQQKMSKEIELAKFLDQSTWENRFNTLLRSADESITYNYFMK